MKDIYFAKNYGILYEEIEEGKCEVYEFEHALGTVRHLFIKRKIPVQLNGRSYYDVVTPYGYGGPIITKCDEEDRFQLVREFQTAFQQKCDNEGIVCEFVRFHPVFSNARDFKECYKTVYKRKTTGTNLHDFEDPVKSEFSKSCRRNIRKALAAGVEYKITVNPRDLRGFKEIYHSTMKRNDAASIYYFDDDYFSKCQEYFGEHLILSEAIYEGRVIGMGLSFAYGDIIHTHLSGTLADDHHLSPAYILQYAITLWGKENGKTLIHDGGGRTGDAADSLYLFKKQFGKNTEFDYYVGSKIWNGDIYNQLNGIVGLNSETCFSSAHWSKIGVMPR